MDKQEFISVLQEAGEILARRGYDAKVAELATVQKEVAKFRAEVLFVGEFSAGKTALVNSLLGSRILTEAIRPETAVATEIVYAPGAAEVVRVKKSGEEDVHPLNDMPNLSPEGYEKFIVRIDSPALKRLGDKSVVDMPGFDSGIEAHNRAILEYVGKAAAYVFVVDAESGTLSQKSLNFLKEISSFSQTVRFILTKCDKVSSEKAAAVAQTIADQAEGIFGKSFDVLRTNAYAEDAGFAVEDLLATLDADALLTAKLAPQAAPAMRYGVDAIAKQLDAMSLGGEEVDAAIKEHERAKEQLEREIESQQWELEKQDTDAAADNIIADFEAALRAQMPRLIEAAKRGNDAFNEATSAIARQTLPASLGKYAAEIEADVADRLATVVQRDAPDAAKIAGGIRCGANALKIALKKMGSFAKVKKYAKMYKISTTGLAVFTSVVMPWMELVIIFLPEILSLIGKLVGESEKERLTRLIDEEAIPKITAQMRPAVAGNLAEMAKNTAAEIIEAINAKIDAENEALQKLLARRDDERANAETERDEVVADLEKLEEITVRLESVV